MWKIIPGSEKENYKNPPAPYFDPNKELDLQVDNSKDVLGAARPSYKMGSQSGMHREHHQLQKEIGRSIWSGTLWSVHSALNGETDERIKEVEDVTAKDESVQTLLGVIKDGCPEHSQYSLHVIPASLRDREAC